MQNTVATNRAQSRSANDLVNLATPLFQLMMKIKARSITPSNEMRRAIDELVKTLEEKGTKRGYRERQLQDTKFALTAFVDETVLAGGFPLREEWERYPLQLEYFKEALAGNKFFERLDWLVKQGESEADVVEIYYLCLLFGFKGKYDVFLEDQLSVMVNNVVEHLRRLGRLRTRVLSPHGLLSDQPEPPPPEPELPRWVKFAVTGAVGVVIFFYLLFNWSLLSTLEETMKERLLK